MFEHNTLSLTTDGDGDASSSLYIYGFLEAVQVDYGASVDAGADLTIADDAGRTIISVTDSNTDAWHYPVVQATDSGGSAITGIYRRYLITGKVTATVAQGGDTQPVTVKFFWSKA